MTTPNHDPHQPNDSHPPATPLMDGLGFSADDLNANRDGFFSQGQRDRLWLERIFWLGNIVSGAFLLCPVVTGLSLLWVLRGTGRIPVIVPLLGAVTAVLAALLLLNTARLFWLNARGDAHAGVARVQGPVHKTTRPTFTVHVNDLSFRVTKPAYHAFHEGEDYALYYMPRTRKLLSAEPV